MHTSATRPVVVLRVRPGVDGQVPTIALCVVIENGGFGGEAAAPAALKMFQAYFNRRAATALATEHLD